MITKYGTAIESIAKSAAGRVDAEKIAENYRKRNAEEETRTIKRRVDIKDKKHGIS